MIGDEVDIDVLRPTVSLSLPAKESDGVIILFSLFYRRKISEFCADYEQGASEDEGKKEKSF